MVEFLLNVSPETLCAQIGEDPRRIGKLDDMVAIAHRAGLPLTKDLVYGAQRTGTGPERLIFGNAAIYQVGDFLGWALKLLKRPEDGPAVRAGRTRTERAKARALVGNDAAGSPTPERRAA
jgi:hypothetical protein